MTYATASDVLSRWVGQGKPADTGQVDTYCVDAETLIAREFPDLAASIEAEDLTEDEVKLVVVSMVTRVYKNPERIRSRTDSTSDQFGGSVVFAGKNPGTLEITDEERSILRGATATTGSTAFTIDPTPAAGGGWIGPRCEDPVPW